MSQQLSGDRPSLIALERYDSSPVLILVCLRDMLITMLQLVIGLRDVALSRVIRLISVAHEVTPDVGDLLHDCDEFD